LWDKAVKEKENENDKLIGNDNDIKKPRHRDDEAIKTTATTTARVWLLHDGTSSHQSFVFAI
jgi:hypothetical protein